MNNNNLNIKNVAIIGLGLIGGSIAKSIKKSDAKILISAYDKNEILDLAFKEKIIDKKLESIESASENDLIILCLPTEMSLEAFKKLIPLLKDDTILTDVCGVKGAFDLEWEKLKQKGVYIGGHPMTGKEKGGYKNSDSLLFENAVYIISDKVKGNKKEEVFLVFINFLGARGIYLDPYLHDIIVANVSHLPQILSVALLNSVSNNKDVNYLDFAAGGFKDLTRIASSDFNVWKSILELNKDEIIKSLDNFQSTLNEIKYILQQENFKSIAAIFEKAKIKRDSIPENKKGFINPLFDLFVYINDEPGVLFNITKTLAVKNINIKDIELVKIRENVGGTFRLSFSSQQELEEAKLLLKSADFKINN